MLGDLEDQEALLGADRVGNFSYLEWKNTIFQFLRKFAALKIAVFAAVLGGGSIGKLLRQFLELRTLSNLLQDILSLGLGGRKRGVAVRLRRSRLRRSCGRGTSSGRGCRRWRWRWRWFGFRYDQNLAQTNLLGLLHVRLVSFVKLLD